MIQSQDTLQIADVSLESLVKIYFMPLNPFDRLKPHSPFWLDRERFLLSMDFWQQLKTRYQNQSDNGHYSFLAKWLLALHEDLPKESPPTMPGLTSLPFSVQDKKTQH